MTLLTVTFYDIICYYLRREQKSPEFSPRGFEPVLLAERTKSPEFSPRGFEPVLLRREQKAPSFHLEALNLFFLRREQKAPSFHLEALNLFYCGENRIRTCEPVSPATRFPGVPLQPLEHLSKKDECKGTINY